MYDFMLKETHLTSKCILYVSLLVFNEMFFRCELCGKVLVRRRDLERHLKSRHMSEMHPGSSILEDSDKSNVNTSEEEDEQKQTTLQN